MKVLHIADIHARDKDIVEIERCLHHIVATAHKEKPDLIINAGDTFDSAVVKADSQAVKLIFRVFKDLADIAPVAVLIGTPSHDGRSAETLRYIKAKHRVWVSAVPEQLCLCDGGLNVGLPKIAPIDAPVEAVISMVPAPTKRFFDNDSDIKGSDAEIAQAMSAIFAGFAARAESYDCHPPHILCGHWTTTGSLISETQTLTGVDIELSKDQMALARADLVCLGHPHKSQQLGDNIFYSGSITGLTWGELDEKGFYIHTLENKKLIKSRFIKTPSRKLLRLNEDLTGPSGSDELDVTLPYNSPGEIEGASMRVELKVFQDEAQKIDVENIKNFYLDGGAKEVDVRLIRVPREATRSKNILKLTSLRDKLVEMASLKTEIVPESILLKADLLESETSERIIADVASS